MSKLHLKGIFIGIAALIGFTFSCTGKTREPIPISVRLGWVVNANSAGEIAALENGYYKDEGLDVIFHPGGLTNPSVVTVASGVDDIGFANAPLLVINARASGAPIKIVSVIQQKGYHGFWVRESSPIKTPKDWEGQRVGVKYASPTFLLYQALLEELNVDRSSITEIPLKYGLQPFLEGDIDVYPGAFTNELISIELMGIPCRKIVPSDYGISTSGNVVFTTETMISEKPKIVEGFVRATARGWDWCLRPENWERTIDYLERHNDQIYREKEREALKLNAELVRPSKEPVPCIGWIDESSLEHMIRYMRLFNVLKEDMDVREIYTDQFVKDCFE